MPKYTVYVEYEDSFEIEAEDRDEAEIMAEVVKDNDYPFETQVVEIIEQ